MGVKARQASEVRRMSHLIILRTFVNGEGSNGIGIGRIDCR